MCTQICSDCLQDLGILSTAEPAVMRLKKSIQKNTGMKPLQENKNPVDSKRVFSPSLVTTA